MLHYTVSIFIGKMSRRFLSHEVMFDAHIIYTSRQRRLFLRRCNKELGIIIVATNFIKVSPKDIQRHDFGKIIQGKPISQNKAI